MNSTETKSPFLTELFSNKTVIRKRESERVRERESKKESKRESKREKERKRESKI